MVLEDDPVTSVALAKALHLAMPDELVLTARTVAEARLLLEEYEIDFFVLDVNLPDGSGIDFIAEIGARNPSASVVIMTAQPLPEYRDQAEAYGKRNGVPGELLGRITPAKIITEADVAG